MDQFDFCLELIYLLLDFIELLMHFPLLAFILLLLSFCDWFWRWFFFLLFTFGRWCLLSILLLFLLLLFAFFFLLLLLLFFFFLFQPFLFFFLFLFICFLFEFSLGFNSRWGSHWCRWSFLLDASFRNFNLFLFGRRRFKLFETFEEALFFFL